MLGILPEGQVIDDVVSPLIYLILDVAPLPFPVSLVIVPVVVACLPLPEVSYKILLLKLPAK